MGWTQLKLTVRRCAAAATLDVWTELLDIVDQLASSTGPDSPVWSCTGSGSFAGLCTLVMILSVYSEVLCTGNPRFVCVLRPPLLHNEVFTHDDNLLWLLMSVLELLHGAHLKVSEWMRFQGKVWPGMHWTWTSTIDLPESAAQGS